MPCDTGAELKFIFVILLTFSIIVIQLLKQLLLSGSGLYFLKYEVCVFES